MVRVFTKGAAERIVEVCTQVVTKEREQALSLSEREGLKEQVLTNMNSALGLRTIALAYKDISIQ